ncbi:acyl-CoA-binding domain-containing protein 5A-like isoform X3 [Anguilla rostrata]|uniref:acyl-CoA-binding domain-containing protein 5A-like isoform X3 n=1 Tax=Anguilla rostrata TaxID=7938 RepID=UPI0030D39B6B
MMADDNKPIHELRFDAAVEVIQSLPPNGSVQPSDDMMLKFYSYYNQATQGPCDIPKPGFWDPVGKVKWEAWNDLGDMPKEEAMIAYVDEVKLILESMPVTDEVERLLQVLGPFYEMVDESKKISKVSDLSAGFGGMLTASSKSMTKSIIRTMTQNGTLKSSCKRPELESNTFMNEEEEVEDEDEEDEEQEEEEEEQIEKGKELPALKLKTEGLAGKPELPLTNGNMEHRGSPLTNGNHGSKSALNGEQPHGELVDTTHTLETTELNGHLSDHNEEVSSLHHLASDSDSEVYCDSVDQFGTEEGSEVLSNHSLDTDAGVRVDHRAKRRVQRGRGLGETDDPQGGPGGVQLGGEDGESSRNAPRRDRTNADRPHGSSASGGRGSRYPALGSRAQGVLLGNAGDGERRGSEGGSSSSLNEQIVTALARLQEDMQSVLQRLQTLEALTASQARSLTLQPYYPSPPASKAIKKPSWWPFDISPGTVVFAMVWPFVVQWLIRICLQRRRRYLYLGATGGFLGG